MALRPSLTSLSGVRAGDVLGVAVRVSVLKEQVDRGLGALHASELPHGRLRHPRPPRTRRCGCAAHVSSPERVQRRRSASASVSIAILPLDASIYLIADARRFSDQREGALARKVAVRHDREQRARRGGPVEHRLRGMVEVGPGRQCRRDTSGCRSWSSRLPFRASGRWRRLGADAQTLACCARGGRGAARRCRLRLSISTSSGSSPNSIGTAPAMMASSAWFATRS